MIYTSKTAVNKPADPSYRSKHGVHDQALREIPCLSPVRTGDGPPLRVLQLTNMYPSEARPNWGVFIQSQIESLAAHGVESEVVEVQGWTNKLHYLQALVRLPGRARARPYDLVHVHYGLTQLASLGIRGLPSVLSFCGGDLLGEPDAQGRRSSGSLALAWLAKQAARKADAIIVKSEEMAGCLGPEFQDVTVIPNGLDLRLFNPLERPAARQKLGWPQDREILLFPANPREPRKNFPLAEEVARRLAAAGRPVLLQWVYGKPQQEVSLAMSAADVMLNCSFQEGSPNIVKEAMAMNLPIVSTDVGDCPERLRGCDPSAVVERSPEAFTRATAQILERGAPRSNGRILIQNLDVQIVAGRVVEVYRRALSRHQTARAR